MPIRGFNTYPALGLKDYGSSFGQGAATGLQLRRLNEENKLLEAQRQQAEQTPGLVNRAFGQSSSGAPQVDFPALRELAAINPELAESLLEMSETVQGQ